MKLAKQTSNNTLVDARTRKVAKVLTIVAMCAIIIAAFAIPTFAATINTGMTTDKLVGGIVDFVVKVAFYIGIVITASGIFMFVMAYKDDNAESQSRGARMAVVGALLMGLQPLLKLVGLIK
ncbi:MAG: hypothetical protein IJZ42_13515 [Lachnospiraceae bacterium]|nr:hypothetical protein [Lachnospiraceae bacterium]